MVEQVVHWRPTSRRAIGMSRSSTGRVRFGDDGILGTNKSRRGCRSLPRLGVL